MSNNQTGLEREMLRIGADHQLATSAHPVAIGHKLTHAGITVDFSEGLLELVTQPFGRRPAMLDQMRGMHAFVARNLQDEEYCWALSMPPQTQPERVRIAEFGPSLSGRMKQVYRQGLAARYGKIMQVIAGVHYNFSFDPRFLAQEQAVSGSTADAQECRNRLYFRLIRGFGAHAWLLPYLFGASPVAARSSAREDVSGLLSLDADHVYGEYATSLRMSDIGYQSPAQADLVISHHCLEDYVRDLVLATRTPWPEYERLGVRKGEDWVQLNANILQIENEYYSAIRPKQIVQRGERPACALFHRGVSYIEVRLLDVDPFEPLGMSAATAQFMEIFLLVCLAHGEDDWLFAQADRHNQKLAVRYGRRPDLKLMRGASSLPLRHWADELLDECAAVAEKMDAAQGGRAYADAVACQRAKLHAPETLPSQRVLDASAGGYARWAQELSQAHTQAMAQVELNAAELARRGEEVARSFERAAQLEREQGGDFVEFVQQYYDSVCGEMLAALL